MPVQIVDGLTQLVEAIDKLEAAQVEVTQVVPLPSGGWAVLTKRLPKREVRSTKRERRG